MTRVTKPLRVLTTVFLLLGIIRGQLASLQHEPDLHWQTLITDHFSVHYPAGFEDLGLRVASICEQLYGPVSSSLNWFPGRTDVVVHTRADFPGGVVTFLPWRMELFVTEPQGNIAGSGDSWLRVVIAHELTHIVHLRKRRGLSTLTHPFLGEFNAFWQNIVPLWFTEGFATLNESRYTKGGAGRVPYTWMQMAAPVHAGRPWRLGSTSHATRKRMPRQRMRYVSGYFLTEWVERKFGPGTWARILDRYAALPIQGFSRAVKSVTGTPLNALYSQVVDQFSRDKEKLSPGASPRIWRRVKQPENQYSPRWTDDDHLMIYRKSFDDLEEVAILDRSGRLQPVVQRSLTKVENAFSRGESAVVWAELHPHPRFSATIYSDLMKYDLTTTNARTLTRNARLTCPDLSPDQSRVAAVQTDLPTTRLVTVDMETGKVSTVLNIPGATLLNPRWSPEGNRLTFSLKDSSGQQNIAVMDVTSGRWRYLYSPDAYHDNNPCWTPDGRFVLYTSERSGVFNIWAVRVASGDRWQVTRDPLGAFTPDVSPDGDELAFASYSDLGFRVATVPLDTTQWLRENRSPPAHPLGTPTEHHTEHPPFPSAPDWTSTPYRSWRHIRMPQGWFPYPFWDQSRFWLALTAISADPLHRHSWSGSLGQSIPDTRRFFDFRYTYRRWWPVLTLRGFSLPPHVSANTESGDRQKEGAEVTASVPLVIESNVYVTFVQPFVRWRRYRWGKRVYQGIQTGLTRTRVAQTPRDIVPYRALVWSAFADWTGPRMGSDFSGSQISAAAQLFVPTPVSHLQVEVLTRYQNRSGNVGWTASGTLPVGHADYGKAHQIRLKLALHLPLAYLEWPVPVLPVWMDYVEAATFYDRGAGWGKGPGLDDSNTPGPFSSGVQIATSQVVLERFPARLGVSFYYHSEYKAWRWAPILELPF
ncbi:MAG: TolB family protein [Fidelibacterota bacterium]